MAFLRNSWYVAAWDDEVQPGRMLHRRILDEPVLLFRDAGGAVKALLDRCPHRFAPLHLGTIQDGVIQCHYHGLKFDGSGECVHNPHGAIPRAARTRSFPAVERHGFIWLWMGEADRADASSIPDYGFQDAARSHVGKGYLHVKSSYLLEIDNIMDLSHTEFVHPTTLGSSGISVGDYTSSQDGQTVWSNRKTHGEIMTDDLCDAMGVPRRVPIDRWIHVRWIAPANMAIYAGAVPAGSPTEGARETPGSHCFTPETDRTSHYWFSICFPKSLGEEGAKMAREQISYIKAPFELEDLPLLEEQQAAIGDVDLLDLKPVLLAGDAGGVKARRILSKLIAEEQQDSAGGASA